MLIESNTIKQWDKNQDKDIKIMSTNNNHRSNSKLHPTKDVFKRLSLSPSRNDKTSKPQSHYKNEKRISLSLSPIRIQETARHLGSPPKRLVSFPHHLEKTYRDSISDSLLSNTREHLPNHDDDDDDDDDDDNELLYFPTSPTKFNIDKTVGGDGSRSRIRSRFKNGLMSPERIQSERDPSSLSPLRASPSKNKNLLQKLERENDLDTLTEMNTLHNSRKDTHGDSSMIPKKRVKFHVPSSRTPEEDGKNEAVLQQLEEAKDMLIKIIKKQDDLEIRMSRIEHSILDQRNKMR
ncbi:Fin1p NDAI_0J01110 [Naumovozyma dairenensis CBS 421]|uniref:Uncharacterized protein n=1 Tax=Naumovozyma dairenensis (strain ATCC 10597 / BCRC 20456 / CBS 421 / NBRC 0211 / NRRL Y-12639) TaxID=1071378 RepID=G0WGS5_NAUDC|nr:hypothetical protein NDAI_0J01110 [Naumovozyma dairenensis CBS 421]CCD27003.1 hypothetical protein NDAI_0J01110 [Naumovozyma dairenensis CBS 421]